MGLDRLEPSADEETAELDQSLDHLKVARVGSGPVLALLALDTAVLAGGPTDRAFTVNTPHDIELPATVELKVVETEPSMKGATAQAQYKPATLETGLKITVPPFINIGEVVQIDTRTGQYLGRAK